MVISIIMMMMMVDADDDNDVHDDGDDVDDGDGCFPFVDNEGLTKPALVITHKKRRASST